MDVFALPSSLDQTCSLELLEVLGGVRDGEPRGLRQLLHGPLALSEEIKQLKASRTPERAPDHRQLLDWEKELIGVYLTEHPLEHRLADLQSVITARSGELDAAWNELVEAINAIKTSNSAE